MMIRQLQFIHLPVLLDYFVYMSNNTMISEVLDPYLKPSKMWLHRRAGQDLWTCMHEESSSPFQAYLQPL